MGKLSRDKGQRGQIEARDALNANGCIAKVTASMQTADDRSFADVTADHPSGLRLAVECKHQKTLPSVGTMKAIEQADEAEPGRPDVARAVAMRIPGKPGEFIWAMRNEAMFTLLGRLAALTALLESLEPTGESSK